MQSHYCVHTLHGQSALITPPSSTHTHSHTQSSTYNTHTLHIQYRGGGDTLSMTPWLATLTTLQMRRPRGRRRGRRGGGTLTLGGSLRQGHPASGPRTVHASRAQPGPLAGWCAPYHPPRRPHRRSRDPCCTQSTTTNTTQTGATVTGWRHGQVTAPGTLPTHLPLLHPLPTRQWGCRHVHSPTTCTLLSCTPPRRCNRRRGHWLGHLTTNVTVPATVTVTVSTHTSIPTTHTRVDTYAAIPVEALAVAAPGATPHPHGAHATIVQHWGVLPSAAPWHPAVTCTFGGRPRPTWALHHTWRRTAPRRCLLPHPDHARIFVSYT
jgi:hypothetical protein